MTYKYIPAFLCCAFSLLGSMAQLQNSIKGRVVQGETGAGIPNASVFITNTSRGTVSDSSGAFELLDVPAGSYDLVISSVGFETQVYSYKAAQLPLRLEVRLGPKVQELPDVVVEPDEKNGWEKWGRFFTENFLGTNEPGRDCSIKNYKTLRFRYSKKAQALHVLADDPLVIENKALGYLVKYELQDFRYDFRNHMLVYYGFTLFSPLDNKGPTRRQLKNREKAYNGSIAHFMRSLYHDSLAEEGFEVRRLVRRPNLEKGRVRSLYAAAVRKDMTRSGAISLSPKIFTGSQERVNDSGSYYEKILHQPDIIEEYGKAILTADSLLRNPDSLYRELFFKDYLYVAYKKGKEDHDYLDYMQENRAVYFPRSQVFLPDATPITIEPTGNYYPPQGFMTLGYWSWNEKVGILLPLDYKKGDDR